jgi:hypothetical protein
MVKSRIRSPLSAATRPIRKLIHDNLVYGTEGSRRAYANARMMFNAPDALRRRRFARSLQPDLRLAVDESNGYRVLQPGTLELADAVAAAAHARCAELGLDNLEGRQLDEFSSAPADGKAAWTINGGRIARLLDRETLSLQSPWLRFALHPDLLTAVSAYLGVVPVLSAMDFWVSLPSIKLTGSQTFHCDWADDRQIRVFVYATDVTEENGPLIVVDAAQSSAIRQAINYRFDGRHGGAFVSDEAIAESAGDSDCHPIVGPRGTVALLDTCRCFHCGSRLQPGAGPRVVTMFQYSRPGSFFLPLKYTRKAPFRKYADSHSLSHLQQLALGGSESMP